MIIPIPAIWRRRLRFEAPDKIDQALDHRTHRLIAGISISDAFDLVRGVLVVSAGRGKFIRVKHCVEVAVPIPAPIRKMCMELRSAKNADIGNFASSIADLADVQLQCVERIKIEAGKYVDRLMAVSVWDSGLWANDFDGRTRYLPFCDAGRLAELCGVSVIDSFPAADLAVNGNGKMLHALPLWLIAADRKPCVSSVERIIFGIDGNSDLLRLPPSDGLDSELPAIEHWHLTDNEFRKSKTAFSSTTSEPVPKQRISSDSVRPDQLAQALIKWLRRFASDHRTRQEIELIYDFSNPKLIHLNDGMGRECPEVAFTDLSSLGFSPDSFQSVATAILGLMYIDQMPANVPWITGAESQRILGRLSPGRPSNWRPLIRMMADFQPAAMKLRDAV